MSEIKATRARNLRYKRPALESMSLYQIQTELDEMNSAMYNIHWWSEQDEETLLSALDGDEEEAYEFKVVFSEIESAAEQLGNCIGNLYRDDDEFERTYDDCTVALIGDRYRMVGYDSYEEDYYSLCRYDSELAQSESGKRLMRRTKAEMISIIGQCVGILVSFLDLRQKYDYLKAAFDVLKEENMSVLQSVRDIERAYIEAENAGFFFDDSRTKAFDRLLDTLPERAWVE